MFKFIGELICIISSKQRKKLLILQALVILMAIAEVTCLAVIGPFMALVGNIDLIKSNAAIKLIYVKSGLETPTDFLFFAGIMVLISLALSAALSVFTLWKLSYFAAQEGAEIGDILYEYYLKKNFLFHSVTSSSLLTAKIATEVARFTDYVMQPLVQINARIIAALFISIAIFIYNPLVTLIGLLIFFAAYFLLFSIVKRKLDTNGKLISEVAKERFTLMNEGFGAIKDIQLLGREQSFIDKFKESGKLFANAYGSSNGLYNMPRYFMELIIFSSMIGLILVLLKMYSGDLSEILPVLAVFGFAAFKLLPSLQQIYSGAAQIRSNLAAFNSIKGDLLSAKVLLSQPETADRKVISRNFIELKDISFTYPNKKRSVLKGINLSIPANSVVGIVGPSGAGKSTLIDILLGLIIPDKGKLYIGETEITRNNMREWQNMLGYVPQNIFLSEGNIIENVAFGINSNIVDMESVKRVIKLANLDEWVNNLPDGYLTKIGERGVQISGGQRQRIGIARALYGDADFLFFDEATSALDGVTEKIIMEAIEECARKKTIILIAHRLNTVKKCDLIFMVDQGKLVDQGSYNYLSENNAYFREMVEVK